MTFTAKSEGRISKVVRRVEREYVNPPARRGQARSRDSRLRRFELIENLAFDSNATAYLFKWNGSIYAADSDVEFEVYDVFSKFNQKQKPTGQDGARGYAQWMWDRRIWEIVALEHQARWIKFTVNDGTDFVGADAEITVDGVTYRHGYEPDTAVVTVYNTGWAGDDDDTGTALYDPSEDKYYIVAMNLGMVKEDVETDFQVDGATQKLQVKTRELFVLPSAAETGWTDKHTGTTCP